MGRHLPSPCARPVRQCRHPDDRQSGDLAGPVPLGIRLRRHLDPPLRLLPMGCVTGAAVGRDRDRRDRLDAAGPVAPLGGVLGAGADPAAGLRPAPGPPAGAARGVQRPFHGYHRRVGAAAVDGEARCRAWRGAPGRPEGAAAGRRDGTGRRIHLHRASGRQHGARERGVLLGHRVRACGSRPHGCSGLPVRGITLPDRHDLRHRAERRRLARHARPPQARRLDVPHLVHRHGARRRQRPHDAAGRRRARHHPRDRASRAADSLRAPCSGRPAGLGRRPRAEQSVAVGGRLHRARAGERKAPGDPGRPGAGPCRGKSCGPDRSQPAGVRPPLLIRTRNGQPQRPRAGRGRPALLRTGRGQHRGPGGIRVRPASCARR